MKNMPIDSQECIDRIKVWKGYPFFRTETRVDWILSIAIPHLLERKFGSECELILPEFPIRKGIIDEKYESQGNRSIKIDYYCLLKDKTHILVELKTDTKSIQETQIEYYQKIARKQVCDILDGIQILRDASNCKRKYDRYIGELKKHRLIDDSGISHIHKDSRFKIVYISPVGKKFENFYCYKLSELGEILAGSKDLFIKQIGELIKEWN